jgi:hypothetical protein
MTFKRFLTVCAGAGLPLAFALQAPLAAWAYAVWQPLGPAGFSTGQADYKSAG